MPDRRFWRACVIHSPPPYWCQTLPLTPDVRAGRGTEAGQRPGLFHFPIQRRLQQRRLIIVEAGSLCGFLGFRRKGCNLDGAADSIARKAKVAGCLRKTALVPSTARNLRNLRMFILPRLDNLHPPRLKLRALKRGDLAAVKVLRDFAAVISCTGRLWQ